MNEELAAMFLLLRKKVTIAGVVIELSTSPDLLLQVPETEWAALYKGLLADGYYPIDKKG